MGLFDKKYCDICGNKISLLGNKKLEDGNMCKECEKKLSNWFSGRRHTALADIKDQLAYREANALEVAAFKPNLGIGTDSEKFFLMDEASGRFVILRNGDNINSNPDLFDKARVTSVNYQIDEDKSEVKTKDAEGKSVSFDPKRYSYRYMFKVLIGYDSPFFDELEFNVSNMSVSGGEDNGTISGGYRDYGPTTMKPQDISQYKKNLKICKEIVEALEKNAAEEQPVTPVVEKNANTEPDVPNKSQEEPATTFSVDWVCVCGGHNNGKFCEYCGSPRP